MHREYVNRIINKNNKESMEMLGCIFDKAMEHVEECDEELYDKLEVDLYEALNGKTFTEEKAKHWVKEMEPIGQRYTIEEATQGLTRVGYNGDKILGYIAVNMMCNDYRDIVEENPEIVFKLAKDFLNDEDAVEHKVFNYWKYIVKK